MKKYINAELTIVNVKNSDIMTTSPMGVHLDTEYTGTVIYAPDRFNDWYEGY